MEASDVEIRVLGCLIEKRMTTPDYYPLTLNSLVAACNQANNRDPVVEYDETAVTRGISGLQERGWCRAVHRPGQRSVKYRHTLDEALVVDPEQQALLAVLMLRGAQTPGELRTRTTRYLEFPDLGTVEGVLTGLATRERPLAERLERRPGEKEARWVHLLGGAREHRADPDPDPDPDSDSAPPRAPDRLAMLEEEVARLRDEVARLRGLVEEEPAP